MEAFLKLPINYSIVTNIDFEHIEYYKKFKNLEYSFCRFIEKTSYRKIYNLYRQSHIRRFYKKLKNKNIILMGKAKMLT